MGICLHKQKFKNDVTPDFISPAKLESQQSLQKKRKTHHLTIIPQLQESIDFKKNITEWTKKSHHSRHRSVSKLTQTEESFLTTSRTIICGSSYKGHQISYEDKVIKLNGKIKEIEEVYSYGIGFTCKKGLKASPYNQDDFSIILDTEFIFSGVFDGHGAFGHDVSNFIQSKLPQFLINHENFDSNIKEAIFQSFLHANASLLEHCSAPEPKFECMMSGTTATTILIKNSHIHIGHTGDSRAILGKKINNWIIAERLTTDHKPSVPEESKRIQESNGEIRALPDENIPRIFIQGKDYPGLSTSRALGDAVAQTIGVSPQPEYKDIQILEEFEYIIICSDGVLEFISDQEAIEIVSKYGKNSRKGAESLVAHAWQKWLQNEEEVADDITAIVMHLPTILANNFN
ncbi:unnamed protein product [Blepharisma stoltei]|uniref:PPM-type phosphatase domain-containing protein n=1 Tax=Blepharisma stoltei TaxID=1481888 RepID=A0AAU9JBK8_9CILI|nr:unnamed protein product [Blepharisma stoltei]